MIITLSMCIICLVLSTLDASYISCTGRCGDVTPSPRFDCNYDTFCIHVKDCCVDFDTECENTSTLAKLGFILKVISGRLSGMQAQRSRHMFK